MLAREAHQLREEAADDAVLASDIADTDYAQLLVGVARHECPGLLLGAHGVAPSKSSLARRVARVLDGKSVRGPAARGFATGVFVGAILVAAPLAALTITPAGKAQPKVASSGAASGPALAYYRNTPDAAADLPHIIASGVSTSVATAAAAITPVTAKVAPDFEATAPTGARVVKKNGVMVATAPSGATAVIYPADAHGRNRIVATASNGAISTVFVDAGAHPGKDDVDQAIELKALGITPEAIAAIKSSSPTLRRADVDEIVQLRAVGVTPEYIRAMVAAGFAGLDADGLVQARATGLTPEYARGMAGAGYRDLDDLIAMRANGISPEYASEFRRNGHRPLSAGELIKLKANNIHAEDLRSVPPTPPPPPRPGDE
jgi:hypothetical protein